MVGQILLDELKQLIAQRIGLRISDIAQDRIDGILRERAESHGCSTVIDYQKFLIDHQTDKEWGELARALTSGETFFFRDHGQFDLLRLHLLPELIAQHKNDKTLRLWSAGCASGEEVYSLAMLLDMLLPECDGWNVLILGTDIDSAAIARAGLGRYGKWSFRMVTPELQQRYFHQEGNEWQLDERIRRRVTLRIFNLVGEPFPDAVSEFHDMDLILCRNVFIYFDHAAVFAVASKLADALRIGGYLMTAHTELIGHRLPTLESSLFSEGVVYQRVASQTAASCPVLPLATEAMQAVPSVSIATRQQPVTAAVSPNASLPGEGSDESLFKLARQYADQGAFEKAAQSCRKALEANPLAATPYFLLAQLAQIQGDFNQAKEYLNKAIYLEPRFVAAYLELAALYERSDELPRARALRRAALDIARTIPADAMIEQYETTAGKLTQWLTQREHESGKIV